MKKEERKLKLRRLIKYSQKLSTQIRTKNKWTRKKILNLSRKNKEKLKITCNICNVRTVVSSKSSMTKKYVGNSWAFCSSESIPTSSQSDEISLKKQIMTTRNEKKQWKEKWKKRLKKEKEKR